ncbi:MAG: hypothetical protein IKU20_03825 [Lachnospiraceae bacterium]|nr:hypothetical protein [Lachnospiraceae bacterium]
MAKKKNKKIVRYRKPLNINIGLIMFALIFVYMAFYVYTYMQRDKVEFYEVVEGSIVNDQRHTGIILREEEPKYTDRAGNINFYMREGKRAAVGTRIYSIDETGTLSKLLSERTDGAVTLSSENLTSLKKELSEFSQTFSEEKFAAVYDSRYELDSEVLEYVNIDTLKNLDSMIDELGVNFDQVRSDRAGIISYTVDGMEKLLPNEVTAAMFEKTNYKKNPVKSGQLVESGAPAYKVVTSSDWSILFPLGAEEQVLYNGKTALTVTFSGKDLRTNAKFSMVTGADGALYGKLDFTKYMEQFVASRFVDFEIITEEVKGLKIPRSAVADVNFFLIPKDFLVKSQSGAARGFYKETYTENGPSIVLVSCDIYNADEDYYYVDSGEKSELKAGDYLVKENSQDRYQVGTKASLQGVYNINRGYTAFRKIEVLNSNDEYYTVAKGTDYGLSIYDHIVLNAAAVTTNGMVIYQ